MKNGLTLIELIVVMAIIALLSGGGLAAYTSFNQSQTLKAAAENVKNNLRLVQSRALSQEKPATGCAVLDGFRVDISVGTANYSYLALCNGDIPLETSRQSLSPLPAGVTFASANPNQVIFRLLGSGATAAAIAVAGFGKAPITINVSQGGEIH